MQHNPLRANRRHVDVDRSVDDAGVDGARQLLANDAAVAAVRFDAARHRRHRDRTVGVRRFHGRALRRPHVVPNFEAGADHDAAHLRGRNRNAVRLDVLVDRDARQQLARARIGRGLRDALGVDFDGVAVGGIHFNAPVRVLDADLAARGERIGVRPFVGGAGGERHAAAAPEREQRRDGRNRDEAVDHRHK